MAANKQSTIRMLLPNKASICQQPVNVRIWQNLQSMDNAFSLAEEYKLAEIIARKVAVIP
jgi:hypothetical protein